MQLLRPSEFREVLEIDRARQDVERQIIHSNQVHIAHPPTPSYLCDYPQAIVATWQRGRRGMDGLLCRHCLQTVLGDGVCGGCCLTLKFEERLPGGR